jgi:hypothetical protein
MLKSIAVIEAPSILGLRPTGLLARLRARHAGRIDAPKYRDAKNARLGGRLRRGPRSFWSDE